MGVLYGYDEYDRLCIQFNDDLIDGIEHFDLDDWTRDPREFRRDLKRVVQDAYDDLTLHELPWDDVYDTSRTIVNAVMPVVESMPETPKDRANAILNRMIRRMIFEPDSGIIRRVHRFTCAACKERCDWVDSDRLCDRCD